MSEHGSLEGGKVCSLSVLSRAGVGAPSESPLFAHIMELAGGGASCKNRLIACPLVVLRTRLKR